MTFLAGKVLIEVVAGAPNNGLSEDNVAKAKSMRIGRDVYPYVSAQAFRRWLRDSMPAEEKRSPVTRSGSGKKQQAYTEGRPDRYLDDDLFGYMVAIKGGKGTCQRDTVLATGTLVAVTPRQPKEDFGTMSRGFAAGENPVLHGHEFYSAELAGDLLLDLPRVGVFETGGSGLKVALPAAAAAQAKAAGADEVQFRDTACLRLGIAERRRRTAVLLRTLAALRGGAKQSLHYGDRTPAMLLLAPMKGGINPFTRILATQDGRTVFRADVLRDELHAWEDELEAPVILGWAPGFLSDQRAKASNDLADLVADGKVTIGHPRTMLQALADRIEQGEHDDWFEEPKR
ncbi:type I-B CRISPR-associated protein Cas7/Cst2/DevR [Salinispora sp. H7-4]|uniref:type I-B CRISPR-associated protein Cas7/Cst2/DevR n=1 Tax=Salinispora sp. H7-4 TaxID=2748321 RepID=UPI0015D39154|nr:type I-B CRISPR-associated protein Cas7/Cst2/DevR [Salinispora sp. H7-4]NYT96416.1 type I-B CRISPR-associated protein Cas7/Cst2/DevR [Salinispora sp. H7-4]